MRHRKSGVKLNRTSSHREAMFRNMVTSLFKHNRIRTTDAKAKELRRWADHLITLAKRGDLHARRQALAIIREKAVVHQLFADAEQRFGTVSGGYTRVVKIGRRPGDAAPVSLVELILPEDRQTAKPKPQKRTKAAKKPPVETQSPAVETPEPPDEPSEGDSEAAVEAAGDTAEAAAADTVEASGVEAPSEAVEAAPDQPAEEAAPPEAAESTDAPVADKDETASADDKTDSDKSS